MVKTILDNFCVKSGIFCSRCEEKLKKGQITDLDIRVIRSITELEKENPTLQDVTFHKAVEAGDIMALMVDRRGMDAFLASGFQFRIDSIRELSALVTGGFFRGTNRFCLGCCFRSGCIRQRTDKAVAAFSSFADGRNALPRKLEPGMKGCRLCSNRAS